MCPSSSRAYGPPNRQRLRVAAQHTPAATSPAVRQQQPPHTTGGGDKAKKEKEGRRKKKKKAGGSGGERGRRWGEERQGLTGRAKVRHRRDR
eukprot:2906343-Rhodomonas_salina.2